MDHEFSTAFLEPGIKGWDWFSEQLSNRTEIMLFLLRADDGSISAVSGGTFVDPEGKTRPIGKDEFAVIIGFKGLELPLLHSPSPGVVNSRT
jgi:predicted secreted hydrolase